MIDEDFSDRVGGLGVESGFDSWLGLALGLTPEEEGVEDVGQTDSLCHAQAGAV